LKHCRDTDWRRSAGGRLFNDARPDEENARSPSEQSLFFRHEFFKAINSAGTDSVAHKYQGNTQKKTDINVYKPALV